MFDLDLPLIADADLAEARREMGTALTRILGYYKHDGVRSIGDMERAMHERDAAAMVLPAHSMKGESRQLGAYCLAELAQHLETTARHCLEERIALPDDLASEVALLQPLFHETVECLERIVGRDGQSVRVSGLTPPAARLPSVSSTGRPVFGRRGA
jgi:HPt (histidine-containing phosphotransfer) domain-containing protein